MVAIITGDIIKSRKASDPEVWLKPLKDLLDSHVLIWDIYRGDSFQVETDVNDALPLALKIKAVARSVKGLDARMAIGIGEKLYMAAEVGQSSGDAHVFSGESFEELKDKKQSLIIKSYWKEMDEEFNMMLKLALPITDNWTPASAEVALLVLENPDITQKELSQKLNIRQSSVSERYKRAQLHEILEFVKYYRIRISKQMFAR